MLPTVRRFSQTTAYSTMNLRDLFVQAQARLRPALGLRLDLRRPDLATAADLWYAGSGATLARGAMFGYAGRVRGGPVVTGTFAGGNLWFGCLESVVALGPRSARRYGPSLGPPSIRGRQPAS